MRRRNRAFVLGTLATAAIWACDRGEPAPPGTAEQNETTRAGPAGPRPTYEFAAGLPQEYPEVCGFVREFLETCLAGNYEDYRRLVSRSANPESKERFEAIYRAIRSVTVETIERLDLRDLPPPAYRVISAVDFRPERKVTLRAGPQRRIAILVFKEAGRWRMLPAPSELQPIETAPAPASAPTSSAPHYPWDQDGDY